MPLRGIGPTHSTAPGQARQREKQSEPLGQVIGLRAKYCPYDVAKITVMRWNDLGLAAATPSYAFAVGTGGFVAAVAAIGIAAWHRHRQTGPHTNAM